jgi:hypothetical protein
MKTVTIVVKTLVLMLLCAYIASANVTVSYTPQVIAAVHAQNGSIHDFVSIGDIRITEGAVDDFKQGQTNTTLKLTVLSAPANWHFNTGVGSVTLSLIHI